jgi:hypothetical protein
MEKGYQSLSDLYSNPFFYLHFLFTFLDVIIDDEIRSFADTSDGLTD